MACRRPGPRCAPLARLCMYVLFVCVCFLCVCLLCKYVDLIFSPQEEEESLPSPGAALRPAGAHVRFGTPALAPDSTHTHFAETPSSRAPSSVPNSFAPNSFAPNSDASNSRALNSAAPEAVLLSVSPLAAPLSVRIYIERDRYVYMYMYRYRYR